MKYFDEEENRYCNHFSTPPPQYLIDIERDTILSVYHGKMIVGQLPGRFLSMIAKLQKPRCVLEIGTFTGYSALCIAEGLGENGKIDSIEINEELVKKIEKNFSLSPFKDKINLLVGDCFDILPKKIYLGEKYDLIFIDGNKKEYPKYLELTIQLLEKNGLMIADNTLWGGKVYQENTKNSKLETKYLNDFNQSLGRDERFNTLLMPFYDGFTIAKRVK